MNTGGTASTARQTLDLLLTKYLKAAVSFEGILQVMQGAAAGADAGTGTKGTAQVTTAVTTEVTTQVTTQVALLQALTQPMARSELQATLRLKNSEHFRKAYLLPALAQGLVEMTLPEKPNSRLQQYRLTAAGRAYLQALASPEPP